MDKRMWGAAVVAASLAFAGCGDSEEVKERKELARSAQKAFQPVAEDLFKMGEELAPLQEATQSSPGAAQATGFEGLADRFEQHGATVKGITPPPDEVEERDRLAAALEKVAGTSDEVADAAEDEDATAAKAALDKLTTDLEAMNKRRNEFVGALKAAEQ